MHSSRRTFIKGLLAAGTSTVVVGFDPAHRSWVTSAAASGALSIPHLDGVLLTDTASLAAYSDDFGNFIRRTPRAVLLPASVNDVVAAIVFCRQHRIKVAGRGQGHSSGGQSLVEGGLVIDLSTLNQIEAIGPNSATVQAGVTLSELLAAGIPLGFRPRVVTGIVGLTWGGVLSMGGIGPASFRHGAVVDNVIEIDVVTGRGELKTCSDKKNPLLFAAVVGGVGQYGIIVRAKVKMQAAPPLARNYIIGYPDLDSILADVNTLTSNQRVDGVYFRILPDGNGGWIYGLNAVKWYSPGAPPNDAQVLAGLNFPPPALTVLDMDAYSYDTFADNFFELLKTQGLYDIPHVWGDVFLPASKTSAYVKSVLQNLTAADLGPDGGFILLFPVKNMFPETIAFRLPREEKAFLFDILTSGSFSDPNYVPSHLAKARAVFEGAREIGGTLYPIGSTPMSKSDWIRQYGIIYPALALAKTLFDPDRILTPGPGIF
ncbi:MAG TPA: FAD-binding protein [Polyangiaceae bacterium]|nr:FAD-binding protein [Polyangiaceae bacterium]